MFRFAFLGLLGSVVLFFAARHGASGVHPSMAIALFVPSVVLVVAALVHWATHPDGIRDTWAGGSISFKHAQPHQLEWSDWALWLTHQGRIDTRANMVRVEKRLLLGLIPAGTTIKSTRDFNQVAVEEKVNTYRRRHRGLFRDRYTTESSHLTLTLALFNAANDRIVLLDLNTALEPTRANRFMQELKQQVEAMLAPVRVG